MSSDIYEFQSFHICVHNFLYLTWRVSQIILLFNDEGMFVKFIVTWSAGLQL